MRGEVALLTRNIKIGGVMSPGCPEENENCKEFKHDTYGAHTKVKWLFLHAYLTLSNLGKNFQQMY